MVWLISITEVEFMMSGIMPNTEGYKQSIDVKTLEAIPLDNERGLEIT